MKKIVFVALTSTIIVSLFGIQFAAAQPYGAGLYNEAVPYGNLTSLSIATIAATNLSVTPTAGGASTSSNSSVVVTSTDVEGFQLYLRASTNTNLTNGASTIPASANVTPAALATNTWGYNTNASANYAGITLSDVLLKTFNTSASTGNTTTVTYGVKVDLTKMSGIYTTSVLYTAVGQTI